MSSSVRTTVNQEAVDRLKSALGEYLSPDGHEKTRQLLDGLKTESVRLSNLPGVVNIIDRIAPSVVAGSTRGGSFQSFEFLTPLLGSLMAGTGLNDIKAYLAERVIELRTKCPELIHEYPQQFA